MSTRSSASQEGTGQRPFQDTAIVVLATCHRAPVGRSRQLSQFGWRTFLRHVVMEALGTGVRPIIVVGHDAQDLSLEMADLDVMVCQGGDWGDGFASSLRTALDVLELAGARPERLLVVGCEQPTVHCGLLIDLLELHSASGRPVAVCEYREDVSMPAVLDRSVFPDIRDSNDDADVHALLHASAHQVARLPFRDGEVEGDVLNELQHLQRPLRSRAERA